VIHHVTLEIADDLLERCIEFYAALDFGRVQPPAGIVGRAVWLERAGDGPRQQIHLMSAERPSARGGHFALVCPHYETVLDRLRARGAEPEPRREHWGSPRCYVRDPAGNLIELMAWPPSEARQ
jgi:catechol 2,3-dioxygenase-like lactoylglutathione lyase family enzyme